MSKRYLKDLALIAFVIGLVFLLRSNEKLSSGDQWNTPTFWKIATVEDVKKGIKAGFDPDLALGNARTPLIMASLFNSSPEVIEELIKAGASVNHSKSGTTPLIAAASNNGNPEIVKMLLKHGADVNVKGINGTSPILMAAATTPSAEVFKILVDAGANLDDKLNDGSSVRDLAVKNVRVREGIYAIIDSINPDAMNKARDEK